MKGAVQPVYFSIMGDFVDEFVDYTVNTNRPADELQLGVIRITEDEMVPVEIGEFVAANTASQLSVSVNASIKMT